MSFTAKFLRRFPVVFDYLNRLNRRCRHQTDIFVELDRHIPSTAPFTFLQVGANDGISTDPFREFIIRPNAQGVTTEPVPEYFAALSLNYCAYRNVVPVNCAVGYPAGNLPFFAYSPAFLASKEGSRELAGLASFTRDKLLACLSPDEIPSQCIQEIIIPVRTVEEIMDHHGFSHFDCLFMDCEGHEENILTQLDYDRVKPRLIAFEHTHFGEYAASIEAHLAAKGFTFTHLKHDTVAVRIEPH